MGNVNALHPPTLKGWQQSGAYRTVPFRVWKVRAELRLVNSWMRPAPHPAPAPTNTY